MLHPFSVAGSLLRQPRSIQVKEHFDILITWSLLHDRENFEIFQYFMCYSC